MVLSVSQMLKSAHTVLSMRQILGAPPSTANTSDSALVIIDAQNDYAYGKMAVANVAESRKVIAELLAKYRAADGKIVHVMHQMPEGTPIFTPGTDLAKEFEELTPIKNGEAEIWKQHPSSFAGTNLQETLQKWGINKIVLVGYMAHVCVSTTTRHAAQEGYEVILVEDGIGDRDLPGMTGPEVTKAVLVELADAFGTVVESKDIN